MNEVCVLNPDHTAETHEHATVDETRVHIDETQETRHATKTHAETAGQPA